MGLYRGEVSANGFNTYRQTGIRLNVNTTTTLEFRLSVGTIGESVSVAADAEMVNTATATERGRARSGATDEIGLHAAVDRVGVHDLHASILALLGLEHEKLRYFFQRRDFRLTDVGRNNLAARLTA